jgi:RNA polymerase sigma-70 factor (ECF subfamily)
MDRPPPPTSPPPDQFTAWLGAARRGDAEALGRLLESYRHYLQLVAGRGLAGDLQAKVGASDLVQETFLDAQQGFARFHGHSPAELTAWLEKVLLHNLTDCARHYRAAEKRRLDREVPLPSSGPGSAAEERLPADTATPSKVASAREQEARLLRALQRLPGDYRTVVVLRHQQARSFEDIGRLLDRSADAARKLWCRAVQLLQKELESV